MSSSNEAALSPKEEEDEHRRRDEINAFAALALGTSGEEADVNTDSTHFTFEGGSFDGDVVLSKGSSDKKDQTEKGATSTTGPVAQSGTFQFSAPSSKNAAAGRSNLEAAATALSGDSDDLDTPEHGQEHQKEGLIPSPIKNQIYMTQIAAKTAAAKQSEDEDSQMFVEEVVLQRPLFFGAVIPPRVLQEGREMVKQAVKEKIEENAMERGDSDDDKSGKLTEPYAPRLSDMPEAVRNLVGALRTYGFGLDELLFDDDSKTPTPSEEIKCKGDGSLSTFQPVWGESVRSERIREFRKQQLLRKPDLVQRTSTAPPRLFKETTTTLGSASNSPVSLSSSMKAPMTSKVDTMSRNAAFSASSSSAAGTSSMQPQPAGQRSSEGSSETMLAMSSSAKNHANNADPRQSDNQQFTAWLRSSDDDPLGLHSLGSVGSTLSLDVDSVASPIEIIKEEETGVQESDQQTEQNIFSQWALGGGSSRGTFAVTNSGAMNDSFSQGTFQKLPSLRTRANSGDSDDDSLIDDENKKQVGLNDHLSKAIASLTGDDGEPPTDIMALEESKLLLSQLPAHDSKARPLTNYELTNGCSPLFGVDDSSLPTEGDLGVHETKEEQQRYNEQKRSQEIIERFVGPSVFGPISCPNPALNPDDFHSWNSRAAPLQSSTSAITEQLSVPTLQSKKAPSHGVHNSAESFGGTTIESRSVDTRSKLSVGKNNRRPSSRSRYGWWNVKDPKSSLHKAEEGIPITSGAPDVKILDDEAPLQLPPVNHSSFAIQVSTPLEPSPETLCEANLPLSRMHAATSLAQALPYVSDRPPSCRYLQINTQSVSFRQLGEGQLGEEIEPMFCSLAIYNIETVSSVGGDSGAAPVPDLQRCGRVTEALNFDIIENQDIARRCQAALWPYGRDSEKDSLQGTRCGVFPVPSNLGVSNLYAVLIVRKVFSPEQDFEPYLKAGFKTVDLERWRIKAEKSSKRHSPFLVPFAFGVAPLLQVFGTDNPTVASSRAVQIPLFRFPGGERHIIDHIMVMLYPRADHRASGIGGPAAVTNGGVAVLVMRNFGYLGLHTVVDKKSKLSFDRLVDFTGELQLRRSTEGEGEKESDRSGDTKVPYQVVCDEWHSSVITEPASNGGRNRPDQIPVSGSGSRSHLYAQELASVPLQLTPTASRVQSSSGKPGMPRGRLHGDDIEPFYHMSFCNELLFHPRVLHNSPKGNIVIKVEVRELEWKHDFNGYFAHLPKSGPSIHNGRRGPFLVQSAFTSCSPRGGDHHFIDEFKAKLPLDLRPRHEDGGTRTLSLFFTVYDIRTDSKRTWKRGVVRGFKAGEASDVDIPEQSDESCLEQIACGFLPLTSNASLLENGIHDVRVIYSSRNPPQEFYEQGLVDSGTLIVMERQELSDSRTTSNVEDVDDTVSSDSRSERHAGSEAGRTDGSVASLSDLASLADDSTSRGGKMKRVLNTEPMSLSIRIVVHSSLHPQNQILTSLFHEEPDSLSSRDSSDPSFLSKLKKGRDFLSNSLDLRVARSSQNISRDLLELTVDVSKHQLCGIPQASSHLWRIIPILWRLVISGSGQPDLAWANPSATLPLRIHAFATILHLVGSTTLYLSKSGVTQIDGVSNWNVVVIGRLLALLFDERRLFGPQALESFDDELWLSKDLPGMNSVASSPADKPKKRRHVRQTFELFNDIQGRDETTESEVAASQATTPRSSNTLHVNTNHADTLEVSTKAPWVDEDSSEKPKPDSKSDFQSALRAAISEDDGDGLEGSAGDGGKTAMAMIQAFSSVSGGRQFMTAPGRALSTIRETDDVDESNDNIDERDISGLGSGDSTPGNDGNTAPSATKKPVKQMRVPNRIRDRSRTLPDINTIPEIETSDTLHSIPKTDEEIESAGTAFLETIGKSLGVSSSRDTLAGEERRVGSAHHRKTHSRGTSIDWSLLSDVAPTLRPSPSSGSGSFGANDEKLSTLKKEQSSSLRLPNYLDRLTLMGMRSETSTRWFPYAYEVIIMQWCAILVAQRRSTEKAEHGNSRRTKSKENIEDATESELLLAQAAARSVGVAVASAPLLFEIIKQSLGFRITALFRVAAARKCSRDCPPVIRLDEALLVNLEQAISMLTDACLDSRNFDSWELRQMSIDVNDSIVRFLRDMFSFLEPGSVHRLILVYLSRFVTKEGKQFQDRDSSIGLRCSWEITKLRINAVTALVRFADSVRVNAPQMMNWKNWATTGPSNAHHSFFDGILEQYRSYRIESVVGGEDVDRRSGVDIPSMTPHWLSEVIVDVCLLGAAHAEPYVQFRSSSLLHEFFWASAQYGALKGRSAPVGSMHLTFIEKMLHNANYLSNFSPKSQLRKDLLPCVIFVLEAAPANLLRALWRKLISRLYESGFNGKMSLTVDAQSNDSPPQLNAKVSSDQSDSYDILEFFGLLNLSLKTMEYEGSEENLDPDNAAGSQESIDLWRREYLLSRRPDYAPKRREHKKASQTPDLDRYTSSISRMWQSHDASVVAVNAAHQVVLEMYSILNTSRDGQRFLNPSVKSNRSTSTSSREAEDSLDQGSNFGYSDILLFLRGATSVYLQSLALRQSDIVIVRTFRLSAEAVKIFGIKLFLEAVGETLQHWMRVIFYNCGARRAHVRVEATDLLELVLRSTWECYGSFFRIRVPLLAVQTEVMERIVATAAARYYRDQRRQGTASSLESFSTLNAEASLVPLWRTLDRIEKQPASQNIAFRGALIRMAEKLKKLYRAYVAARVLSFIQGNSNTPVGEGEGTQDRKKEALIRARRISVLRVINSSEGYSKQFLGFQGTSHKPDSGVAHFEAVEDALIDAADVFSPTELPEHRVAWLRMLADLHRSRKKFAEEATCRFHIHTTLQQASLLHGSLWSNTPFLPWTDNMPDPVYFDGEGPSRDPDFDSVLEFDGSDPNFGRQMENSNSFRRIFYRVANSVGISNEEWEGGSKTLFYGVTYPFEFHSVSPWISFREMEESMIEEAEAAGELYLRAGIVQSSRVIWNLATQYYSEKFNYAKLAIAYGNLSRTVVTQVPTVDTSLPQEVSATLGRFYRVWLHGGLPAELSGVEFVYRADGTVLLDQFGEELRQVIKSVISDNTPIHLVLDGRSEEKKDDGKLNAGFSLMGPASLEPARIKITPLRPLSRTAANTRGRPEWFARYIEEAFSGKRHRSKGELGGRMTQRRTGSSQIEIGSGPSHREHLKSFSATIFSSSGSSGIISSSSRRGALSHFADRDRVMRSPATGDRELAGVDKFCFVQPKDRKRLSKEWWKPKSGDLAEKTLKVTQLQVAQSFPACVARQEVVHRIVYTQSPLEAGIDAICQWCAVLFRTAVATVGQAVLGETAGLGIGEKAMKVVADSVHFSKVREFGLALLRQNAESSVAESSLEFSLDYDRLTEDEVKKLRLKIAKLIIVFIELIHILLSRNRDLLLDVFHEKKKNSMEPPTPMSAPPGTGYARSLSAGDTDHRPAYHYNHSHHGREGGMRRESPSHTAGSLRDGRIGRETLRHARGGSDGASRSTHKTPTQTLQQQAFHRRMRSTDQNTVSSANQNTVASSSTKAADKAKGVQGEMQRAFISMCKALYPCVHSVMNEMQEETPRWLKSCTQDNYFVMGTYRQTKIPISEELCFNATENMGQVDAGLGGVPPYMSFLASLPPSGVPSEIESPRSLGGGGSIHSSHSVHSRGSDRFGSRSSDRFNFANQF